ncbi:MAG: tetratricopeptide repeat protein [Planctomycetota bacterium]
MRLPFANWLRFIRTLRLERALARYRKKQGPREALRLVRTLLKLDRAREALELSAQARRAFPQDPEILEAHEEAKRKQARRLLAQAHRALRAEGSPENFVRVVDLSRALGDFSGALRYARDALARFPDDWAVHECAGKLFYYRFAQTRDPEDSSAALEHLITARNLNPASYAARVLLAIASLKTGDVDFARSVLSELRSTHPDDPRVLQLWDCVEGLAHAAEVPSAEAPEETEAARADEELPVQPSDGVLGYFVFDGRGELVEGQKKESTDLEVEDRYEAFREMLNATRFDTRPLGIGALTSLVASGGTWQIAAAGAGERAVVAFLEPWVQPDDAAAEATALLEESLVS